MEKTIESKEPLLLITRQPKNPENDLKRKVRETKMRLQLDEQVSKKIHEQSARAFTELVRSAAEKFEKKIAARATGEKLIVKGFIDKTQRALDALNKEAKQSAVQGREIKTNAGFKKAVILDQVWTEKIDVFAPPYAAQWTNNPAGGHAGSNVHANQADGTFGFSAPIGDEGGSIYCAAGIAIQFVPTADGYMQVRPYTPYGWSYFLVSDFYTAHVNTNFGILVYSYDLSGNDRQVVNDFRYNIFAEGSAWLEEPGDNGYDNAFVFGHESPWMACSAGRIYQAFIWAYGTSDAEGDDQFAGSWVAQNYVDAQVPFVVVDYFGQS